MPLLRCRRLSHASARLRDRVRVRDERLRGRRRALREHLDRVHRALLVARRAARAAVIVELVAVPLTELDHRVLRARPEAPIALAAVPAREAPMRLERRLLRREAADHLAEISDALGQLELGLLAAGGIAEVPQVQLLERSRGMLRRVPGLGS